VVPMPTVLLLGGLLAGLLLALLVKPLISAAAGRAARRAEQRLTAAVDEVAEAYVVTPIREVLASYAAARESLERAGQPR